MEELDNTTGLWEPFGEDPEKTPCYMLEAGPTKCVVAFKPDRNADVDSFRIAHELVLDSVNNETDDGADGAANHLALVTDAHHDELGSGTALGFRHRSCVLEEYGRDSRGCLS
jgi:hypothetical protein